MLNELVMLNTSRTKAANAWEGYDFSQAFRWQTCLRNVVLMHQETMPQKVTQKAAEGAGYEVYRAERAYQFLLEVICGLHSPLMGETEVLGQFKEMVSATRFSDNRWGSYLRQVTTDLLRDAKRIRQQYLQHLGHRSYGSHASQWLHAMSEISVLGAGQLVGELVPWLTEHSVVRVYARNPMRAAAALGRRKNLHVDGLYVKKSNGAFEKSQTGQAGLVIAAPLSANEICAWIEQQGIHFSRILDLRGEAVNDPLPAERLGDVKIRDLQEFFSTLKQERQRGETYAAEARNAIAQIAQRQLRQMQCRPYGWEDLCA